MTSDDDEPGDDAEAYELDELLDSSVSLSDWVDRSGTPAPPVATVVYDDEVSATTPTRTLAPYESEYEGYMGNYGNTMDRWYRRGAVVLWPTRLDFEVRAEASPQWALDTLQALIRDGDLTRARERAESLTSFWTDLRSASDVLGEVVGRKPDLRPTLAAAHGLDDAALAAMLLAPFRLEDLTPPHAALLAALAQRHGESWTRTLLAGWNSLPRWRYAPGEAATWLAALPELCRALRDANGLVAARLVLAVGWEQLTESLRLARVITQPSRRALALDSWRRRSRACSSAPRSVKRPRSPTLPSPCSPTMMTRPCGGAWSACCAPCRRMTRKSLRVAGSMCWRGMRWPNWNPCSPGRSATRAIGRSSRPVGALARCASHSTTSWLIARLRALDWPLKEQSRRHVHQRIDGHELPVKHSTRRVGRPYMLQLVKTPALFEREKQERQAAEADLQWLHTVVS